MKKCLLTYILLLLCSAFVTAQQWIRINQLGYKPGSSKVAIWCSKEQKTIDAFHIVDAATGKKVFEEKAGNAFGAYGPFTQTYRLNFSSFKKPGRYIIRVGNISSPEFEIGSEVYKGTADFCLRYMRQQRSYFNPFLKDSCHTHDAYTLYGPMPDSTRIDVAGGWHDASDYLQYASTSANATWHLLAAYRDFPAVFTDKHIANGLEGKNGRADVLDEAKWGLDWLLKMHPQDDWLFNQIADDRDHQGMRIPKEDSFYGRGYERPVYFATGKPQGLFKYKNRSTGIASIAAKFTTAFGLGYNFFRDDTAYRRTLSQKANSAFMLALNNPGVCQTAPGRAPYFYEEDNWVDDMELAYTNINATTYGIRSSIPPGIKAFEYAGKEKITPWLGTDTARHYQWYPFVNAGHYEAAKMLNNGLSYTLMNYYKEGIEKVWAKAKQNAFYRGIPFIWCSNNLTTSFAIQCFWYRDFTGDSTYRELEQANFDWLFGCNPWGTSMVYGLPAKGDTPEDPHSAFTHLKNYPIDGGLVDGPVYGSIYKNLIGITLYQPDEYAGFQSDLVVYHDDYGDYSTNEPTMDGTASLVYLLAAMESGVHKSVQKNVQMHQGAIIRGSTKQKQLAIVFTGDEFADGGDFIARTFQQHKTNASFFFTGRFYRNPAFEPFINKLVEQGHYLGAHSDQHLLYCDWSNRDSLLVTKEQFEIDLLANYKEMDRFEIRKRGSQIFLPPYEWYNHQIADWTNAWGDVLINNTPGTKSAADYTTPAMKNYIGSAAILESIFKYERENKTGLNGFILLMHVGTDPARTDKFYHKLPQLLNTLKKRGYEFVRVDELLSNKMH